MHAASASKFTAERTAAILIEKYVSLWGCPVSLLPDNGLQSMPKAVCFAVYKKIGMGKNSTSSHHPNGSASTTPWLKKLVMVVNEQQNDWGSHLPTVKFTYGPILR